MSAIYGLLHFDGRRLADSQLDSMSLALLRHGPDGGGVWKNGVLGMGHRLQAFTPEDLLERQPLVGGAGHVVLVVDGRIDNRPELAAELGISAPEVKAMPDSAFVLRAYEKWGTDCPEHLVGTFTFAVVDLRESRMLLARSASGERALFYHTTSDTFAFASAPKGLFALPFVPRRIHEQQVADYLAWVPGEPGSSFYAGLNTLPAGQSIEVRLDGQVMPPRRFWRPDSRPTTRFARDEEYEEALTALLERVVRDHSRSLTPVGVSMSGGLDSTSVAAVAASQLALKGERLATFTEVPRPGFDGAVIDGRYADETPYVEAMARRYPNLDLNLIRTDGSFYLDGLDAFFAGAEAPFGNASNRSWIEAILHAAGSRNVRVLLTGTLGNSTISWSGAGLLAELAQAGKWARCWQEANAEYQRNRGASAVRLLVGRVLMAGLPGPVWGAMQRVKAPHDPMFNGPRPWHAYSPIRAEFAASHRVAERASAKGHDFHRRQKSDVKAGRIDAIAGWGLRADLLRGHAARFGVDKRDPTGDQRMVEFCLSLPDEQYRRNGEPRWLIRRAMDARLPPEVLNARSRGLQAADWLERLRSAQGSVDATLASCERSDLAADALDLPRLRSLAASLQRSGRSANEMMLDYRCVLEFGLMMGSFLVWFESESR